MIAGFSVSAPLFAQEEAPPPEVVEESDVPDVFLPSLDDQRGEQRFKSTEQSEIELEQDAKEERFWEQIGDIEVSQDSKRNSYLVGVGTLFSNHGLSKAMFKVSQDDVLLGEAGEKSFGVFLLLDLGWRGDSSEALRVRWGMARTSLAIPDSIRSSNDADSLEESLSLMTLDFNVKQNLDLENDDMRPWWGAGLGLRYAFSSQTSGSGSNRVSQLRHSSAIAPLLSLGADFPTNKAHFIFAQLDWLIFTGYQFSIGLSTRL